MARDETHDVARDGAPQMELLRRDEAAVIYEMAFHREGLPIYGQLYLPKEEERGLREGAFEGAFPAVIIAHGFQGSHLFGEQHARAFAEAGFAACTFDFCGGSPLSRSGGDMLHMSVLTEKEDLLAVYRALAGLPFLDAEKIFLMGESQGGFAAALLAQSLPQAAGLILFFPAFCIPDDARRKHRDREHIPDRPDVFRVPVGRMYYADTIEMDPYAETCGYEGPVLIVHGDEDPIAPLAYSERAAKRYRNAELIVLHGAGHGFFSGQLEEAIGAAVRFAEKVCGRAR